mgnify:CR=1 FL=1
MVLISTAYCPLSRLKATALPEGEPRACANLVNRAINCDLGLTGGSFWDKISVALFLNSYNRLRAVLPKELSMEYRPGSSRKQGGLPLRKEDDKRQGAYHSPLPSAPCPPSFFGRAFHELPKCQNLPVYCGASKHFCSGKNTFYDYLSYFSVLLHINFTFLHIF